MSGIKNEKKVKNFELLFEKAKMDLQSTERVKVNNVAYKIKTDEHYQDQDSVTQKYVIRDILRTASFIIFAILIIFLSSVVLTDNEYAKDLRAKFKINQIKF